VAPIFVPVPGYRNDRTGAYREPAEPGSGGRYLEETDPRSVSLRLDTGHLAHRRADVPALIRKHRIGDVHSKQMNPATADRAHADDPPFGRAVAPGAGVGPPAGRPDVPSAVAALSEPIATRTRQYPYAVGPCSR
jgi:inosose dehydratase